MQPRLPFAGGWTLLAVFAVGLWLTGTACAAAPAAHFGRDGIAFHFLPRWTGGVRSQVSILDLAQAPGGKMVAALGSRPNEAGDLYFGAARFNADGSLDRSFGRRGFAALIRPELGGALGLVYGEAAAVAVAPDGGIILAGYRLRGPQSYGRFPVVVRLRPDGAPDRSFGRHGVATPRREPGLGEWFSDVAVEPSGRIVAVGAVTQVGSPPEDRPRRPAALVRGFRPDGRLDRGFGKNGTVSSKEPRSNYYYTALTSIRVLRGGGLLVFGYSRYRLLLQRLTADGRPDQAFGRGGSVTFGFEGSSCIYLCEQTGSLIVTDGGKILVQAHMEGIQETTPTLVRFLPDGRVDRSFGRRGVVRESPHSERLGSAEDIARTRHGRVIVVGSGTVRRTIGDAMVAMRFDRDGERDESFGRNGFLPLERGTESAAYAALARRDGSVVAGGVAGFQEKYLQRVFPELLTLRRYP